MSIISFLGLGSVFDTKLPIFGWLYDSINQFVKKHNEIYGENYNGEIRKDLERQLYLIVSDHIHERLYQGVHRPIEERVRLALMMKYSEEEIRKAVNYMSKSGDFGTAMHYVTCEGYAMILRVLLERRGNPNLQAMKEETPLQRAIFLYNDLPSESSSDYRREGFLRVISVLLCFQADRQRLKPGTPKAQPSPIENEFKKQMKSNEKGQMSTVARKVKKAFDKRDSKKIVKALNECNLGLLNLIQTTVPEFEDLSFEIGALFQAVKLNKKAEKEFNLGDPNYKHKIDGTLQQDPDSQAVEIKHPELKNYEFMNQMRESYYSWGVELRTDVAFLMFLKECFDIIFEQLHRTPEDNPKNGANLLHYFIMIPYFPLCQSVLAHSPELIHRQDNMGNTPLHCAFFAAMEEESIYEPILQTVIKDEYMMHFFNFDKFNLARQTLLHLISERGTQTKRIVKNIGTLICEYINLHIKENRHLKVDLNIADTAGWTPFLQLCYKNDPLALPMARFAHLQELDINLTCPGTKYTALHHAVRFKNDEICKLLLNFENFKQLRVTSFDLISRRASIKLIDMGFKYVPKWVFEEHEKELKTLLKSSNRPPKPVSEGPHKENFDLPNSPIFGTVAAVSVDQKSNQSNCQNSSEKVLLKRITHHPPIDREYVEIGWQDLEFLTASPLLEVLIIEWTELFNLIVYHSSLDVVDSCRGLKLALELGYNKYVNPLICNLVGVTKEKLKRPNRKNSNKRLHMDLHEGHLNTWCLNGILDRVTAEEFRFEDCPKVPKHLLTPLESKLNFNHVISIDLGGNSLDRIPDGLLFLTEVKYLNLQVNDIDFIPDVQFSPELTKNLPLPALKDLNINSNRLKGTIPLWIICHKNLEKLNLAHNYLNFVQDRYFDELGITDLETKLREVILQKNKINFIPRYIKLLKMISDLNLSNNAIEIIPSEIWLLYKMNQLDLSDNSIAKIEYPSDGYPFTSVNDLGDSNQATILEGRKTNGNYCRLRELKLSSNKLKEPPNGLVCVTPNLHRLFLKENKDIEHLNLRFLPRFLRYLDYSDCQIKEVTYTKDSRPCFASCQVDVQQKGICDHLRDRNVQFIFLTDFYLNGNKKMRNMILGEDDDYEKLFFPSLKHLHLHDNDLHSIPPHIGYQKNLESLDISNNQNLHKLPKQLGNLKIYKRLTTLRKEDLVLTDIPSEASLPVVLNILRAMGTVCHQNRRFKLALVGYQGRGKTTLLKTLQSKNINNILSTEGIDINRWDLINPDKKADKIEFEAWDFAGQQDYYPTHHCFLSPRSVYLLVFRACDRQKGITELDGWLKSLEMMAPGCPVLLVGTHIDEIEQESLQSLAQEILVRYHPDKGPFPMIADICFITCRPGLIASNKEQVKSLKKAIYEVASHLHVGQTSNQVTYKPKALTENANAFINQKVPEIYTRLEKNIKSKANEMKADNKPPFLNIEDVWVMIGKDLFKEKDLLQDGLEYLHHLGVILNFETTRLKDLYFLDPQWLSKSMAILIRDHHIRPTPERSEGQENTTEQFLSQLLDTGIVESTKLQTYLNSKNKQLSDWIEIYVELLEKFEVVLRIDNDQILVPSFLPDSHIYTEKPLINFSNLNDQNIETEYYHLDRLWFLDHIPYGFWARFISRLRGDDTIQDLFNTRGPNANKNVKYCLSKSTFEIHYKNCTLLEVLMDESSTINRYDKVPGLVKHYYQIRVHLNLIVWSVLTIDKKKGLERSCEASEPRQMEIIDNVNEILPLAAILLHTLSNHYKTLLSNWYKNMQNFVSTEDSKRDPLIFYTPCQKCSRGKEDGDEKENSLREISDISGNYIYYGRKKVNIFSSEDCVKTVYGGERKYCVLHNWDKFGITCPDLIFVHMRTKIAQEAFKVEILYKEILGVGGFGLVCKGILSYIEGRVGGLRTVVFSENKESSDDSDNDFNDEERKSRSDRDDKFGDIEGACCPEGDNTIGFTDVLENDGQQIKTVALKFLIKHPDQKAENFRHFLTEDKYTVPELLEMHTSILNEMSFCINLKHPNVVELLSVGFHTFFYLIFEIAPCGSMKNIIEKYMEPEIYIKYEVILKSLEEICVGLKYLHEEIKIIHMDMKPDNILVWSYPVPDAYGVIKPTKVHLKIADYGLVYIYSNMGNKLRAPMGTPGYMAPEVLSKTTLSIQPTADIYAIGIIIYQLLTVNTAAADIAELIFFEERKLRFPLLLHSLVKMCCENDPEKRATSQELLSWLYSPEMSKVQLHVGINMGRYNSIIRTHYSQTSENESLPQQVNILQSSAQESPIEGHWTILESGSIELNRGHSNSLEKQDLVDEKELSLKVSDISRDEMPPRRSRNLESRSKNRSTATPWYSSSKRTINEDYINRESEGLEDLQLQGGEMAENYKCQHTCQLFISYDKQMENSDKIERCLSNLAINSNQDMSIKLFECGKENLEYRVNAICLIKNTMWLGTDKGEIVIFRDFRELQSDPNQRRKPAFKATVKVRSSKTNLIILDLQHLPEWKCVLATTSSGDIFWINDDLQVNDLTMQLHCHLSPPNAPYAINRLQTIRTSSEIQIWCTRGSISNPLTIVHLPIKKQTKIRTTELVSDLIKQPLQHISSTTYNRAGISVTKVWTSIMNRSLLICWDTSPDNINTPTKIDISKAIENDHGNCGRIFIKSLLAVSDCLYVGTNDGSILRYSLDGELLAKYKWFIGNVRQIVQLPSEIEWCLNKNAFFPINTANFKCSMDKTYSQSLLLAAVGEGLDVLKRDEKQNYKPAEYVRDKAVFTVWRELGEEVDIY